MKGAKDSQRDAGHAGYETEYSLTEDEALVLRETGQPLSYRDLNFLKHLVYAEASCDETIDHLDTLLETGSLTDRAVYERVRPRLLELARRLNRFIAAVEAQHESPK